MVTIGFRKNIMPDKEAQIKVAQDNNLDALVRAEQIHAIYRNTPILLLSNIVVPFILIYVLWNLAPRTLLLLWAAMLFLVMLVRMYLFFLFNRASPQPNHINRWGYYLILLAVISGLLWGISGSILISSDLLSDNDSLIMLVQLILAGLGAGSVISYAIYRPAFYAFFLPTMTPFMLEGILNKSQFSLVLSIITFMYVVALSFFANNLQKILTESLRLRFRNSALIEELKVQHIELIKQKESAERANAAKTRFLAAASHDLRQPLHAMGLFVTALGERVRSKVTRKLVDQLSASTDALRELLNSLLDISRLDAGVIHPQISSIFLTDLINRIFQDYTSYATEKNITLKFVPSKYWVKCDATLLERILRNLISNSLRYTEHGGVLVGCRSRGNQVRISVWDSGIGIAHHELNKIFHEFYQIGNPERDRSLGLGLGLAIAQRLARLLDLRIEVCSVLNKGTVFSLNVPKSDTVDTTKHLPTSATDTRLQSALLVVIDDELAIRDATKLMLEDWGCEVVLADSAATALSALVKIDRIPDVIIADYRLRNNKTGAEAILDLHAKFGTDIPAIIVTGDTAPDRLREAESSGNYLLHKPLAPGRLRALLSHILSRK